MTKDRSKRKPIDTETKSVVFATTALRSGKETTMHRLFALMTAALVACASLPNSAEDLARALTLRLEPYPPSASFHEKAKVRYVLTNTSETALLACIGEGRGYHVFGTAKDYGEVVPVDHASCVRSFRLGAGQDLAWDEEIKIGDVGKGGARLKAWIQIVDPQHCDRKYGCGAANVTAPFVTLDLAGRDDKRK